MIIKCFNRGVIKSYNAQNNDVWNFLMQLFINSGSKDLNDLFILFHYYINLCIRRVKIMTFACSWAKVK